MHISVLREIIALTPREHLDLKETSFVDKIVPTEGRLTTLGKKDGVWVLLDGCSIQSEVTALKGVNWPRLG